MICAYWLIHRPASGAASDRSAPAISEPEVVRVHPKDVLGRQGEQLAAEYLEQAGFRVLDRNFRCAEGEIDIVAADHRVLVACEVKTRSSLQYGTPIEAIDGRKLKRLRRLAVRWVLTHGVIFDGLRVDVVGVLRAPGGNFTIEHVRGVG